VERHRLQRHLVDGRDDLADLLVPFLGHRVAGSSQRGNLSPLRRSGERSALSRAGGISTPCILAPLEVESTRVGATAFLPGWELSWHFGVVTHEAPGSARTG